MERILRTLGSIGFILAVLWIGGTIPAYAQVTNGSFETGDFTGWTRSGFINTGGGPASGGPQYSTFVAAQALGTPKADTNGVETSQTTVFDGGGVAGPAVTPTNGSRLAFVSNETSEGDLSLTGSSISQTFTIPAGTTALTLDLMLLNNDVPVDFLEFDDFGGIALTQGSTVLAQFNADLAPASPANLHGTANANAGGFRNSTPWTHVTFNVAPYAGQSVTLTAYSINYGGDNQVETRLLIDNIQVIAGAAGVPALSLPFLILLALGLAGSAVIRFRRGGSPV
jgi:hypothetical protein